MSDDLDPFLRTRVMRWWVRGATVPGAIGTEGGLSFQGRLAIRESLILQPPQGRKRLPAPEDGQAAAAAGVCVTACSFIREVLSRGGEAGT